MARYWDGRTNTFEPIPNAYCYVLSNDKFMSDYGKARGKINTCVVPCSSLEEAEAVVAYAKSRGDQKFIRIGYSMPRNRSHVLYSLCEGWAQRVRTQRMGTIK